MLGLTKLVDQPVAQLLNERLKELVFLDEPDDVLHDGPEAVLRYPNLGVRKSRANKSSKRAEKTC